MSENIFAQATKSITEERSEKAQRAIKAFRAMQPGLTGYARAITGRKDVVVELAKGIPRTDGKKIMYKPPIALGDNRPHERMKCDRRNPTTLLMICPACRVREEVLVAIYHEIGHIVGETFEKVSDEHLNRTIENALEVTGGKYAKMLKANWDQVPDYKKKDYLNLSSLISPYLPILVNALEDARVDENMFKARKGIRIMFDALFTKIFREGIEEDDGSVARWIDRPLNSQVLIGVFVLACEYKYEGWFAPEVEEALADSQLKALVGRLDTVRSAEGTYSLAFPILARLRELGFCKSDEDPEDEEPEEAPEEETQDEPEEGSEEGSGEDSGGGDSDEDASDASSGEDSESASEAGGDGTSEPPSESEDQSDAGDGRADPRGTGSEDSDADEDSSEASDVSGDPGEGDSEESDGESGGEDGAGGDSSDAGESSEESDADGGSGGERDGDPVGDDESTGSSEGESDDGGSPDGESSGDAGGSGGGSGDPDSLGGPSGESEGESGDDAGEGEESAGNGESERDGESSDGGLESQGDSEEGSVPDDKGDLRADESGGDGSDKGNSEEGDGEEDLGPAQSSDQGQPSGIGDSDEAGSFDGEDREEETGDPQSQPERGELEEGDDPERVDTGADEGEGGTQSRDEKYGTHENVVRDLQVFTKHDDVVSVPSSSEEIADDAAVEVAIMQGEYFERPSVNVSGVREHKFGVPFMEDGQDMSTAWEDIWGDYFGSRYGVKADLNIPESVLGPALLQMRRTFEDNARAAHQRNLQSGRVNPRVLGRRAPVKDDRLFTKKRLPGKRSYAVLLGIDISGSTVGENLALAKRAAMAQAELCDRMGIDFAIYAHTANGTHGTDGPTGYRQYGLMLDVYQIKGFDEPWSPREKGALEQISSAFENLDGHGVEYYRKAIERHPATDKIILYYSDGKMPAANYAEELEILQREIAYCKRKNITLLGVGIRTDSPRRHGLDTVEVNKDEDVKEVVHHLESAILHNHR